MEDGANLAVEGGPANPVTGVSSGFEEAQDRSLYWTVSFYLSPDDLPASVRRSLKLAISSEESGDKTDLRKIQKSHNASRRLAEAMEPLFNDISDRERLGRVDDYLFAVDYGDRPTEGSINSGVDDDAPQFVDLTIRSPAAVRWETEGVSYEATPGECEPKAVRLRRFWYVHKNGALSWHLSFRVAYDHTPADFYFLSMMQKVLAPKEFRPADDRASAAPLRSVHLGPPTGIEPLDKVFIASHGLEAPFWQAVAAWFAKDAPAFFGLIDASHDWRRDSSAKRDWFGEIIKLEPFLEIPGLMMPRFRFMFFFKDEVFFHHLLPPLDKDTKRPIPRASLVQEKAFDWYLEALESMAERPRERHVVLGNRYWRAIEARRHELADTHATEIATRKQKAVEASALALRIREHADRIAASAAEKEQALKAATSADHRQRESDAAAARASAIEWAIRALAAQDRDDADNDDAYDQTTIDIVYLFLSGFNQNIIDFMNQDASEILDSIDPIYPATEDQETERFFVRFANARALTSYVRTSRSLETGNDYIGTCPYAFLIHVVALHNEFLARDYEHAAHALIDEVQTTSASGHLRDATQAFYTFRTTVYTRYFADRYDNVFRYDTESDVFEELEQRRGISRKTEYIGGIVSNLETQTELLLARLQRREDRVVTYAVGGVGAFGFFQMMLQIAEMSNTAPPFTALQAMNLSLAGTVVVLAAFAFVILTDGAEAVAAGWRRIFPPRRKPGGPKKKKPGR